MTKELDGKRIAILAEDYYEEVELWYPYYRLKEAGASVTVVGSGRAETYKGKNGLPVTVDRQITGISADDFDGVIIPGGFAPDLMRRTPEMVGFVRDVAVQGKPVAAVCHGGWMLISAGLVKNRDVTSFFSIKDDVEAAGGRYRDEPVVVDQNIITARVPADLPLFLPRIIAALRERA